MYIEKYWGNYIGGTDDSLALLDYLVDKQKTEIALGEIFADIGLDKLNWDFRTSPDLGYINSDGMDIDFYYAIDLITDLAALLLECSVNGNVSLDKLMDEEDNGNIRITCTEEQKSAMNKALADFVKEPLAYDLHEMVPDEDMQAMVQDCENLRRELCE